MNQFGIRTEPFGGPTYSPTIACVSGLPSSAIRFDTLHPIRASRFLRFEPRAEGCLTSERLYLIRCFQAELHQPQQRVEASLGLSERKVKDHAQRQHCHDCPDSSSAAGHRGGRSWAVSKLRASSENQTVMSPRLLRPRSYSRQLVARYFEVVRLAGLEPATYGLGIHRSILLSYRRIRTYGIGFPECSDCFFDFPDFRSSILSTASALCSGLRGA